MIYNYILFAFTRYDFEAGHKFPSSKLDSQEHLCCKIIDYLVWCVCRTLPRPENQIFLSEHLGLYSLRRRRLTSIGIPIINLRRSDDRLRFIMGIPILIRRCLLSEYRPCSGWLFQMLLRTIYYLHDVITASSILTSFRFWPFWWNTYQRSIQQRFST